MEKTAEQQIYQKLKSVSSNKSTSEFVAGNIKNFIEDWKDITNDSMILGIVENGLKIGLVSLEIWRYLKLLIVFLNNKLSPQKLNLS